MHLLKYLVFSVDIHVPGGILRKCSVFVCDTCLVDAAENGSNSAFSSCPAYAVTTQVCRLHRLLPDLKCYPACTESLPPKSFFLCTAMTRVQIKRRLATTYGRQVVCVSE